ncbi:hypothetical protein JCM8208_005885 [Rhodotorula glutinis]
MGLLLENALSEELPDHPQPSSSSTAASTGPRSSSRSSPPPPPPPTTATDTDKMLAASIGALLTSLTMTPFDVVKTRLQTQAPPRPSPHSSLPRATATTSPWPPPIPSTSSAPPPPPSSQPAVCCNSQAYFNANASTHSNPARDLLCRFDPRTARAALPAAGAHLHHLHAAPQLAVAGADGAAAAWCLYPAAASSTATAGAAPTASASRTLFPSSHSTSPSLASSAHAARPPPPHHHQRHLTGFLDALTHILRAEGPAALWRGTAPALAMSVPGQVGYMVGYDALRRTALRHLGASSDYAQAAQVAVPLVAGSASRAAVAVVLSPFELVRTRLQAQTRSTRVPLRALVAELRWSTAWRGLSSTLWRDVPFSGVYWAGYEGIKRALTGGRGMGEQHGGVAAAAGAGRTGAVVGNAGARGEFATAFVSGAGSGMIAATLTNPFDVVKTRRQAPSASTKGDEARTLALLRHIVRTEGWAAPWSGLTPRLAKVGPACGLMIGCYEGISGWRGAQRATTERGELE